ncbi:MAG: hypothetical protein LC799_17630 [Actinobacteria bacterium]|nr:hypothetical protein [Actinomycetota bacterium]
MASLASEVLPPRQIQALWLTAAGYDVQQVANHLGVHYRAAESLLARARRTLRALLLANLSAGLGQARCDRAPSPTASSPAA